MRCLRPQAALRSKVSHSNRKTNRRFNLNLQIRRMWSMASEAASEICTRCLRTMVKVPKVRKRAPKSTATRVAPVTVATAPATTAPETVETPEATAPATE